MVVCLALLEVSILFGCCSRFDILSCFLVVPMLVLVTGLALILFLVLVLSFFLDYVQVWGFHDLMLFIIQALVIFSVFILKPFSSYSILFLVSKD